MKSSSEDSSLKGLGKVLVSPSFVGGVAKQVGVVAHGTIFPPKDCFDHGNNSSTIIMVPGFCCNSKSMEFAGEILKEKYNVAYAPRFPRQNTDAVDRAVIVLREKLRDVLKKEKNGDVSYYTHSAGGIITSRMLGKSKIDANALFTCASPFKGTPPAKFFTFLALARDLCQGSELLRSLDINLPVSRVEFHVAELDTIAPPENQVPWVIPANSSCHYHSDFQHFDFIAGEKAKTFVGGIVL